MGRRVDAIKAEDISTDDLWFAANREAKSERTSWTDLSNRDLAYFHAVMDAIRGNAQMELEYAGILECAFENYDADNS